MSAISVIQQKWYNRHEKRKNFFVSQSTVNAVTFDKTVLSASTQTGSCALIQYKDVVLPV